MEYVPAKKRPITRVVIIYIERSMFLLRLIDWCFRPRICTVSYARPGTTWDYEMTFVMNHVPGA